MTITFDNLVTIIAAIVTVGGTIIGVVLANRMTASRSYKEKIWDFRRAAYGIILAELAEIERIYDSADEYITERSFHDYFEHKAYSQDNAEIAKRMSRIHERFSGDYLILSDRFIELYNAFQVDVTPDPFGSTSTDDDYYSSSAAVRKFRPLLIERARQEMASHERWWPSS
jgi:hypothetical protein